MLPKISILTSKALGREISENQKKSLIATLNFINLMMESFLCRGFLNEVAPCECPKFLRCSYNENDEFVKIMNKAVKIVVLAEPYFNEAIQAEAKFVDKARNISRVRVVLYPDGKIRALSTTF